MDTAGTGDTMMSAQDCDSINNGDQRLQCFTDALDQVEPQPCRDCEMANIDLYRTDMGQTPFYSQCHTIPGNITTGDWSGSSRAEACVRMLTCIRKTGCAKSLAISDCVCMGKDGMASDSTECFARPSLAKLDGPCKNEAIAAAEIPQNGSITDLALRYYSSLYAVGIATTIVQSDWVSCGVPCNACIPGDTCVSTGSTDGSGGTSGASAVGVAAGASGAAGSGVAGQSGAPRAGASGGAGVAGH
jgi:hypothetical protein